MIENLDILQPAAEDSKSKKNKKQATGNSMSYRGFNSIDQEMERDIAMQWFGKVNKSHLFRGNTFYKGKLS